MRRLIAFVIMICPVCLLRAADTEPQSAGSEKARLPVRPADAGECLSSDHFLLFHNPWETEGEKIAYILELTCRHFFVVFGERGFELQRPASRLEWVIFTDKDAFRRYALATEGWDLSWLSGYYSSGTNRVAIMPPVKMSQWAITALGRPEGERAREIIACPPDAETSLAQLVHETAHQLAFNTGLQKRKVMYPLWASEGLAMDFEHSLLMEYCPSSVYIHKRARQLVRLYRQNELMPLDKLVALTHLRHDGTAIDIYAQVWGFYAFLRERYADALVAYYDELRQCEAGWRSQETRRREFVRAFGSAASLKGEWGRFLAELAVGEDDKGH